MAEHARPIWTSDRVHGAGGRYHVVVTRLPGGRGAARDRYSATLYRTTEQGEEAVEAAFWEGTTPPHDADKLRFREKARRAAAGGES